MFTVVYSDPEKAKELIKGLIHLQASQICFFGRPEFYESNEVKKNKCGPKLIINTDRPAICGTFSKEIEG